MSKPIEFLHNSEATGRYTFVIIIVRYNDKWLFVRHRDRSTWELPAGHVEDGESVDQAAKRELEEETGAGEFELLPLVSYKGMLKDKAVFGKIYRAEITSFGPLPELEIAEVRLFDRIPENLTYPDIQPLFIEWYKNNCQL